MAFKQLKLWFDRELATNLCKQIVEIDLNFDSERFINSIVAEVDDLELKDRVRLFAKSLHDQFDRNYNHGIDILLQILGPANPKEVDMFKEYYWIMPIARYVEDYGLDDFGLSMKAIEEITKRNTGEYAIRPFIENYPRKTLKQMLKWSKHKNFHVRRLASEGGRPRLPWASKLQMFIDDPVPLLPVLEILKDDPSKYVQNSVANCINDFIKDNRPVAEQIVESWILNATKERKWIIKHAIRNLRKKEDQWAMEVVKQIT